MELNDFSNSSLFLASQSNVSSGESKFNKLETKLSEMVPFMSGFKSNERMMSANSSRIKLGLSELSSSVLRRLILLRMDIDSTCCDLTSFSILVSWRLFLSELEWELGDVLLLEGLILVFNEVAFAGGCAGLFARLAASNTFAVRESARRRFFQESVKFIISNQD